MGEVLLKLAERVEALTGPDREVDAAITLAIFPWVAHAGDGNFIRQDGSPYDGVRVRVLEYTASLDAATTLVPDGYDWAAGTGRKEHMTEGGRLPWAWCETSFDMAQIGTAATPALALCAAALRAVAHKGADHG